MSSPPHLLRAAFIVGCGASSAFFLSKISITTNYSMFNIGVSSTLAGIGAYLAAVYAETH